MRREEIIFTLTAAVVALVLAIVGFQFARKALVAWRTGVAITATRAEHRRADMPLLYWLTVSLQGFNALACLVLGIAAAGLAVLFCLGSLPNEGRSRPSSEIAAMECAAESYKVDFGQYPAGDNRAVQQALTGGGGPPHKAYLELNKNQLSSDGQIVDPWGTPYQFEAGEQFVIRSAGPNRKFETPGTPGSDDISSE